MTGTQIAVLAILGLVALGGIGIVAKLILANGSTIEAAQVPPSQAGLATSIPLPTDTSLPSSAPTQASTVSLPTDTPMPTSKPVLLTLTFTATSKPVLPTPTFTATTTASLIPAGWTQYKYQTVEMWMPVDFIKKSSKDAVVYAENKNEKGNGFVVSVGLTKDTPAVTTLDDYIRDGLKHFTPETTFLEKKKFEIGTYEAVRLKMQVIIMNVPMGEAIYFIKDGGNVWIISGLSHYDEFHTWLPIFDQIARTFHINP